MPAGRYLRTAVLNWIRGTTMPAAPSSVYLHLCTTAPSAAAIGTAPAVGNYAPRQISPGDWGALATGTTRDSSPGPALRFPASGTFTGTTEIATHAMLMDGSNPATANLLDYGALGEPRTLSAGGFAQLGDGDLTVSA